MSPRKENPAKPEPRAATRLVPGEWDFSEKLLPVEVPFCLLWELARESAKVERHVADWRGYWREVRGWNEQHGTRNEEGQQVVPDGKMFDPSGERQRSLHLADAQLKPKVNFPFTRDALKLLIGCFGFAEREVSPWQLLKPEGRKKWIEQSCGDPSWFGFSGHPAVRTGCEFDFGTLSQAAREKRLPLKSGRHLADASCFDHEGRELVLLVIDWPGFNDMAIKQGLDKWWKEKEKPARPAPPVKRGRGIHHAQELRVMMDNLGFARLRARYTPKQIFANAHAAWTTLMGPCEFEAKSAREFEGKLSERAERFWDWFPKTFPFDTEPPKSQRDFERRKTRTGPPKRKAPCGE